MEAKTPGSSKRLIKPRYEPTPRISARKKSLFADKSPASPDSLGMSPLQMSCSPLKYDEEPEAVTAAASLKRALSDRTNQILFTDNNSDGNKYEILRQPTTRLPGVVEESPPKDGTDEMSTPSVSQTQALAPRLSFRKSVNLENHSKTPQEEEMSPNTRKATLKRIRSLEDRSSTSSENEASGSSKARTSLSFVDGSIPVRSFYSSSPAPTPAKRPYIPIIQKSPKGRGGRGRGASKKATRINKGVFHKVHKQRPRKKKAPPKVSPRVVLPAKPAADMGPSPEQVRRLRAVLQNRADPIEMARPLNIAVPVASTSKRRLEDTEEESDLAETEGEEQARSRKFFKSNSGVRARYKVNKTFSATVEQGRIIYEERKRREIKRPVAQFEEEAEVFTSEQEEVNDLLRILEGDNEREATPEKEAAKPTQVSPTTQISNMTSTLAIESPEKPLFPVFYKGQTGLSADSAEEEAKKRQRKPWRTIGDDQLQIDAGQKAFGATQCSQCGFLYTVHVPEDELLHLEYHSSIGVLKMQPWEKETVVLEVPEWGVFGRVQVVSQLDSKPKLKRVEETLKIIDLELGFAKTPLHAKAMVYLACNKDEILGICVAEPIREAFRLISDFGIDFCSSDAYPVRCGISRIWVAAKYRRSGVARRLLNAVRAHFIFGYHLSFDEIAFSAPTEVGKKMAEAITGKSDFFVYQ